MWGVVPTLKNTGVRVGVDFLPSNLQIFPSCVLTFGKISFISHSFTLLSYCISDLVIKLFSYIIGVRLILYVPVIGDGPKRGTLPLLYPPGKREPAWFYGGF
ncbi:hypothetical protein AVEN_44839-1 [Araneus ventricosus]|uniref:Uncharacterized protein n=1 Tax=Araneus ventricosus TaxID=182803 RepID=A0A4Y2CJW1_ARAVE|nr:hypothetical protein AVEN_44839-1 [Araneus ventricosus]